VTGLIRAEWLKLRSVRSNVVLMVAIALLSVGLGALLSAVVPLDDTARGGMSIMSDPLMRVQIVTGGFGLGLTLIGVLGVQVIAQEHRFNTIRVTFSAVPQRGRVMAAKAAVLVMATLVITAVLIALSVAIGGAILSGRGTPLDLSVEGAWRLILGTWLLSPIYALAGFGLGMVVRQPIGAIVALLAWTIVIENVIVGFLADSVGRYMPFHAGSQVVEQHAVPDMFGPWAGFAYFCGFAVLLCVIGMALTQRRDA